MVTVAVIGSYSSGCNWVTTESRLPSDERDGDITDRMQSHVNQEYRGGGAHERIGSGATGFVQPQG